MACGITVIPTISAGVAYASGDAVGGRLEFEDARTPYSSVGKILRAVIKDRAKQNAHLFLVLFNKEFTATADNSAFTVSDSDLLHCLGGLEFTAANYVSFHDNSIAELGLFGLDVEESFILESSGTTLYGQLMVQTSTPTYVATTDLAVSLLIGD